MNDGVIALDIKQIFKCKDIYGRFVEIDLNNMMPFYVVGMDIPAVMALRLEYLKRNGPLPITMESVKQVFSER